MTDGAALLAAILAAPDDDAPRLVYADWLEEHGEETRAEFIRMQINMARCRMCHRKDGTERRDSYAAHCGRCVPGRRRVEDLLEAHADSWLRTADTIRREWHRGFVESVTCAAADWMAHGDSLSWHPDQTDPCPEPRDPKWGVFHNPTRGGLDFDPIKTHKGCLRCEGKGRVPRPCPPTAQPVEEVRLTTWPAELAEAARPNYYRAAFADAIKRAHPQVKRWHLPPEPVTLQSRRLMSQILVPQELLDDDSGVAGRVM